MSEVCSRVQDSTHFSPKEQTRTGDFKYITAKNIKHWGLDLSDVTYVPERVHREIYKRCNVEKGDVLYIKDGVTTGIATVNTLDEEFSLLSSVALLKPQRDILDSLFLKYYLNSPEGFRNMTGQMTGTAIKRLILQKIKAAVVPVAPLPKQQRIVAEIEKQFTRLEAGVAALRRVQANLKRYRAAVLKAACEGRLVLTEAELVGRVPPRGVGRSQMKSTASGQASNSDAGYETGEQLLKRILAERRKNWEKNAGSGDPAYNGTIAQDVGRVPRGVRVRRQYKDSAAPDTANLPTLPEGWKWATLDALAEIKGGITKDQNRQHTASARPVPYLRVANVQRGYIDLTEVKEIVTTEDEIQELALKSGDILFNEGGDRDKLGRGWVWNGELPECIHQNHVFRARLQVAEMNPQLVSWYANTFGQKFFFDEGKHTTNLASITMAKLKGLPVPIPPPAEQTRIVAEVERRLSVVEELEAVVSANLQRATGLRQSILQKAFTGGLTS